MRLVVRLVCDSCGQRTGGIHWDADGLLVRYSVRRKFRGTSEEEARRWEFGGAVRPPRQGPPPDGAVLITDRGERRISDPRRDAPPAPTASWGPDWTCRRCTAGLRLNWDLVRDALYRSDSTGGAVDLRLPRTIDAEWILRLYTSDDG